MWKKGNKKYSNEYLQQVPIMTLTQLCVWELLGVPSSGKHPTNVVYFGMFSVLQSWSKQLNFAISNLIVDFGCFFIQNKIKRLNFLFLVTPYTQQLVNSMRGYPIFTFFHFSPNYSQMNPKNNKFGYLLQDSTSVRVSSSFKQQLKYYFFTDIFSCLKLKNQLKFFRINKKG